MAVDPLVDWVNVTVGVRTTYVRDMATERPPLLDDLARVRSLVRGPLIVSHAFRDAAAIDQALAGGADMVGMARALIADPDLPRKVLSGRGPRGPALRRLQPGLPGVRADAVHGQSGPQAARGAASAGGAA
jgi:2,4-dienoyl-CoA reductase-like NADH-dependent reductase (Old Yellow Enzyme family)